MVGELMYHLIDKNEKMYLVFISTVKKWTYEISSNISFKMTKASL